MNHRNHVNSNSILSTRHTLPRMNVHQVFQEFADGTSMHGVPRIINARSVPAKIFWSGICIAAFVMFFWQSSTLLERFWSYPKKVTMEMVQRPIEFPAVTVCNADHLDLLVVKKIESFLMFENGTEDDDDNDSSWADFKSAYEMFTLDAAVFFQNYLRETPWPQSKNDMLEVYSRLGLTANLGDKLASAGGIVLSDFVISCRFMDGNCNVTKAFKKYFDPYYFNCFTFDPRSLLNTKTSRLRGVEYGLTLLLFEGSAGHLTTPQGYDYLIPGMEEPDSALASGKGARVVVHPVDTIPYPTAEGYDIPPGFSVTIGVKARENKRIGPPHGNCTNENMDSNYKYTLTSCQNDCLLESVKTQCKCIDNRLSLKKEDGLPYCFELPTLPPECNMMESSKKCTDIVSNWGDTMRCRKEVYSNMTFSDPSDVDSCRCYPPCNDILYESLYSLSKLPEQTQEHTAFYMQVGDFIDSVFDEKKLKILNSTYALKNLDKHISRLNVHIADSNVIKTTESPDYEAIRLVSDIGGQLGLWIGISVMTLFEVMQLVADVCRYATLSGKNVSERRNDRLDRLGRDRVAAGDRDRDLDHCEIDKLTAV